MKSSLHLPALAALALATALTACGKHNVDEGAAQSGSTTGTTAGTTPSTDTSQANAGNNGSGGSSTVGQAAGDMAITAKVNAALAVDDKLKATQINVDTREGQVTLTGQAPDAQSRERATTLVSAVDGVKNVNNQLVVAKNG